MKREYEQRQGYPTDLTDTQWVQIEPLFVGMREYKHSKRELLSFFRRANEKGLWDNILEHMVKVTRQKAGRNPNPSYALIDSQSVKTAYASEQRGFDGGKKRKAGKGI